jgi:tetratricopeptide (TPR) repeat protein
VGLIDVAPTLLALVGAPPLPDTTGVDLRPMLRGVDMGGGERRIYSETMATFLDHGWSPLWAARSERHRFILAPRAELYDVPDDAGEHRNLATARPALAAELADWVAERARAPARSDAALTSALGDAERERLESLGYVVGDPARGEATLPDAPTAVDPKDEIGALEVLARVQADVDAGRLEDALKRLATLDRDDVSVAALRAAIAVGAGDPAGAERDARRVLEAQPARSDLWIVLGRSLARQDRLAEARDAFATATRLDPHALMAWLLLGRASAETGRPADAVAAFEQAHRIDPGAAEPVWRLAMAAFESGDATRAAAVLAEADRNGTEFAPGVTARLARLEARSGAPDRAARRLQRARERFPDDPELARVAAWLAGAAPAGSTQPGAAEGPVGTP